MTRYFKATRPDGRDFYTGTIDYGAALLSGETIRHPERKVRNRPQTYLSVSTSPSDCTGFGWPCRLFEVESVGQVMAKLKASPNKRAVSALRVVAELPAHEAFGPRGEEVVRFLEQLATLTPDQARELAAARDAAWAAAWAAARDAAWAAAWAAARDAAWAAARDAAWDAARAVLVRDLISADTYATLTKPFSDAGLREWVA